MPTQIKPKLFQSRPNSFFLPEEDAPRVYVRAWALYCFCSLISTHTPGIVFRHLPPNSATEGALFISPQLSTDAVSALQKVWVLIRLWKQPAPKHARKHETHPPRV